MVLNSLFLIIVKYFLARTDLFELQATTIERKLLFV